MAQAKTEPFDPELVRTAALAKALAHPVRIRILEVPWPREEAASAAGLSTACRSPSRRSPSTSRSSGTPGSFGARSHGPRTCYCLDPKAVAGAGRMFACSLMPFDNPKKGDIMSIFNKKGKESERLKELVRDKYGRIAKDAPAPGTKPAKPAAASSCCCSPKAAPCCAPAPDPSAATYYGEDIIGIKDAYAKLDGHVDEADLGLGCGHPTALASLAKGEVVLDLGSGAGIDCFLAADKVGETGRAIGVDMTPEMIERARENAGRKTSRTSSFGSARSSTCPSPTPRWTSSSRTASSTSHPTSRRYSARRFERSSRAAG